MEKAALSQAPQAGPLDVRFPCGSDICAAWLYLPDLQFSSRAPIIVMGHGIGGTRRDGLTPFARRFQAAGYACLVFDYRTFGHSTGAPRELISISRQRQDWRAAVSFARARPEIDPDRVIVWGTSFGGGHAIVTAADDPRIAAAIVQCPFTDGAASSLAVDLRTSLKVAWRGLLDLLSTAVGGKPVRVPTAGLPHSAALMTAPDALDGFYEIKRSAGLPLETADVPARIGLQIAFDYPGRRARDLRCPVLFSVCLNDTVAPAKATLRHAVKAPLAEIHVYPERHFGIYVGAPFERNVSDQIEFLATHVPA